MKHQIQFKNPDLIYELIQAKHPSPEDEGDMTQNIEDAQEAYGNEYFEYGDYVRIEIDAETLACRLLPRREWD